MHFESRKKKKTDFQLHSHLNIEMIMSELAIFKLLFVSVQNLVLNHSNENEFDLHENTKLNFLFAWVSNRTRFETEAKRNSVNT